MYVYSGEKVLAEPTRAARSHILQIRFYQNRKAGNFAPVFKILQPNSEALVTNGASWKDESAKKLRNVTEMTQQYTREAENYKEFSDASSSVMSSVHCVVVWEWQSGGQWLPHTPAVTRTLERAHAKKLTRVVLADADPALRGHYVNLRTLTQCEDTADGGSIECLVRRSCYGVTSPPGRGVRWEWARFVSPPHPAELLYEPMPMEMQCLMEEAWCNGSETVNACGWSVSVSRMTARGCGLGGVRLLRRAPQPPYPLTRSAPEEPLPQRLPAHTVRHPRIPQQHTGSSVQSVQSVQSAPPARRGPAARAGARSVSPRRDRKPGLARQILHNLNIFSNNNKPAAPIERSPLEQPSPHSRAEGESGRRHSVDTVSTYLSHESKDSLQRGSVGELLNCSAGSDDVFDASPPPLSPADLPPSSDTLTLNAELLQLLRGWVRLEACPQWGALCPACLRDLRPCVTCVAFTGCQHMLHLSCLQRQLQPAREPIRIECLVCGRVYECSGAPRAPAPPPAPEAPGGGVGGVGRAGAGAGGAQPAGSMAWSVQPTPIPAYPNCSTILVTYSFQSGRQGPRHPLPGARYYAVGFPRHTLLPDTPLGRQVLSGLRSLWASGQLFGVSASQTTGREHVVAWRVPPPPAAADQYPPLAPLADRLLRGALARLQAHAPDA